MASVARIAAALAILAGLGACASADRDGARTLATAGVTATGAISAEVTARADRLAAKALVYNFDHAYTLMRSCGGPNDPITNTGRGGTCDIVSTAEQLRDDGVSRSLARLAHIVRLRAQAVDQLAAAYRALGAEADYDARGDFETKIGQATQGVNTLAGAVGLGPLPALATTGARILGGQLATNAQQRRLVSGSARLQAIAIHLREALAKEQALHAQLDAVASSIEADGRRSLAIAGLVDPLPALREVVTSSAFPVTGDSALESALGRDNALNAAAQVAALAQRPDPSAPALQAAMAVLDALIADHRDFEARRTLSLADLTASVARLTELVAAAKADLAPPAPPAPPAAPAGGNAP
jgi:hypothetical protein